MAYRSKFTGAEVDSLLEKVQKGEAGGSVTVDSSLSTTSENPVMNKIVTEELNKKAAKEDVTAALNSKADNEEVNAKLTELSAVVDIVPQIVEVGVNKFNPNGVIYDKVVINSSGEETPNIEYQTTDFIRLAAGDYTFSDISFVAFYDTDKVFISPRNSLNESGLKGTFSFVGGYVRVSFRARYLNTAMITLASQYPSDGSYIPYLLAIKSSALQVSTDMLKDSAVTMEKTSFVKTGGNLINQMTLEYGYVMNTSGDKVANNQYIITDFIPVEMGKTYSFRKVFRVTWFDKERNVVTEVNNNIYNEDATIVCPNVGNIAYAICSLTNSAAIGTEFQMVEGAVIPPYEPQHLVINGFRLRDMPDVDKGDLYQRTTSWDKYIYNQLVPFLLEQSKDGIVASDKNTAAIYAKYDELMTAHPSIITKSALGDDGNGTTLYRYDFALTNADNGNETKSKIFLVSGVHPEYSGIYGLYYTMKAICEQSELVNILEGAEFIVIPVANAYGIDNGTRTNQNGVDLARNFTQDWEQGSAGTETYGGTSPLSEKATQYIDAIMANNKDIAFFASCHSFQMNTKPNYSIWCAAATNYTSHLSGNVVNKLSKLWCDKYNYPSQFFGFAAVQAPKGSEGRQAARYGIQGGTFEVGDYFRADSSEPLTGFAISRATEVYINLIASVLESYSPQDKQYS